MHYLQEIIRAQKEPRWPCEKCAQCAREWQQLRLYATYVASWSQATTCPDTKTLTGPIPNIFAQYAAVVFQTEVTCAGISNHTNRLLSSRSF